MEDRLAQAERDITKLMSVVGQSFNEPALLSQLIVRLAHATWVVGSCLAILQGRYRVKRREVYEQEFQKHGKVTRAKEEAENAARELEETYDKYNNIHSDTLTFINVCQSHLKTLALEAKNSI